MVSASSILSNASKTVRSHKAKDSQLKNNLRRRDALFPKQHGHSWSPLEPKSIQTDPFAKVPYTSAEFQDQVHISKSPSAPEVVRKMNVFVHKEGEGVGTGWDEIEEALPSVAAAVCLTHTLTHTYTSVMRTEA